MGIVYMIFFQLFLAPSSQLVFTCFYLQTPCVLGQCLFTCHNKTSYYLLKKKKLSPIRMIVLNSTPSLWPNNIVFRKKKNHSINLYQSDPYNQTVDNGTQAQWDSTCNFLFVWFCISTVKVNKVIPLLQDSQLQQDVLMFLVSKANLFKVQKSATQLHMRYDTQLSLRSITNHQRHIFQEHTQKERQ